MLPLSREPDIIIPSRIPIPVETWKETKKKQNKSINKMKDL
jgi:hypothetical protein